MLKEVFSVEVTQSYTKDGNVLFNPPAILHTVDLKTYPTHEEIERLIISLEGDGAHVRKSFRMF